MTSMAPRTAYQVSVIVPTLAAADRTRSLQHAIDSIRRSSTQPVRIIAVVNGNRFDRSLCDWLQAQPDVLYEYVANPSAPGALLRGRELVDTEFFSTLDDDDEFLPGGLDLRLQAMRAQPSADLLVTDAYRNREERETRIYTELKRVPQSPLECLMQFPWLNGDNALYRSRTIELRHFQNYHPHAIWTWLAFKLAMEGRQVAVLEEVTCRINDTAMSVSKSKSYEQAYVPLFRKMLALGPPPEIARMVRRKLSAAHHDASVAALAEGRRLDAWKQHLSSIAGQGGLRYLSYTRRLIV